MPLKLSLKVVLFGEKGKWERSAQEPKEIRPELPTERQKHLCMCKHTDPCNKSCFYTVQGCFLFCVQQAYAAIIGMRWLEEEDHFFSKVRECNATSGITLMLSTKILALKFLDGSWLELIMWKCFRGLLHANSIISQNRRRRADTTRCSLLPWRYRVKATLEKLTDLIEESCTIIFSNCLNKK